MTLGMAAELHDQMLCGCGCGHWAADAHDPANADRVVIDQESCVVRAAINDYVEKFKPGPEVVLSASIVDDPREAGRSQYEQLRARLNLPDPRQGGPGDDEPGQ